MSILEKLRAARPQTQPEIDDPSPVPQLKDLTGGNAITGQRSRGRPRRQYKKADVSLDNSKLIMAWIKARVVADPDAVVPIGQVQKQTTRLSGRTVRVEAEYETQSIVADLRAFCKENTLPDPVIPKTLCGLILATLEGIGIQATPIRTQRRRRSALKGIRILGEPKWDGSEPDAVRYDLKHQR